MITEIERNEILAIPDKLKKLILAAAGDSGMNFIFYDRKEDEELPGGLIEDAIEFGIVTVDEIVEAFRAQLIHDTCVDHPSEIKISVKEEFRSLF